MGLFGIFKKEVQKNDLGKLLLALKVSKKDLNEIYINTPKEYSIPSGFLNVEPHGENYLFNLEVYSTRLSKGKGSEGERHMGTKKQDIKKMINYQEIEKNPLLEKYFYKSLSHPISILSIVSISLILASTFFLAGSITGNAILTNNANSSGIIGAGLFVLGLGSWILVRNI